MVKTLTTLFVLMITSIVQAQALAVRTVEKQCHQNRCRQITGIGTCAYIGNIDDKSIYLTAAHVVNNTQSFSVGYGGKWWPGRVAYSKYAGEYDYAIIETRRIPAQKSFEVAEWLPESGSKVIAYGYSKGMYNLGAIRSTVFYKGSSKCLVKKVDYGDSGGPVLSKGEVVGIINSVDATGNASGSTYFTDVKSVVPVIRKIYGRLPKCFCSPVAVRPVPTATIVPDVDRNGALVSALQVEVTKLKSQLDQLSKTKIPVQIIDADGKVITEQKYPLGDPIKLRFKAVKK